MKVTQVAVKCSLHLVLYQQRTIEDIGKRNDKTVIKNISIHLPNKASSTKG